jgi:hypothetical protein
MLAQLEPTGTIEASRLMVARKALNASASDPFQVADRASMTILGLPDDKIVVSNVQQVDGHYVVLVASR